MIAESGKGTAGETTESSAGQHLWNESRITSTCFLITELFNTGSFES